MVREVDMTGGGILRKMLFLSLPIGIVQFITFSYNLVDTFWIGQLGQDSLSSLFFAWPIIFVFVGLGEGLSQAGTILISQNWGGGNEERARRIAAELFGILLGLGVLGATLGYTAVPLFLTFIGAPPDTQIFLDAAIYARIMIAILPFTFVYHAFKATYRGFGDTWTPMFVLSVSLVLNVLLDPVLIFGPQSVIEFLPVVSGTLLPSPLLFEGRGVEGAAIATAISRTSAAVIGVAVMYHSGPAVSVTQLWPEVKTVKQLFGVGSPIVIENGIESLGTVGITAIAAVAGPATVAALGLGNRILSVVAIPALSVGGGVKIAVGQNVGAELTDRARRVIKRSAGSLSIVSATLATGLFFFGYLPVEVMVAGENPEAVRALSTNFLTIIAPTLIFADIFTILVGAVRGSGDTKGAMLLTGIGLWLYRIPIAYILVAVVGLGATGVWIGFALSNVLMFLTAFGYFALFDLGTSFTETSESADSSSRRVSVDEQCCNCGAESPTLKERSLVPTSSGTSDTYSVLLCKECRRVRNHESANCDGIVPVDRDRVLSRSEGTCRVCGVAPQGATNRLELHPIVPLSGGGHPHEYNVIPLCSECHDAVHGRTR